MNNQQELRRALKSFYCGRSLPRARVDFLLQAKTRMAKSCSTIAYHTAGADRSSDRSRRDFPSGDRSRRVSTGNRARRICRGSDEPYETFSAGNHFVALLRGSSSPESARFFDHARKFADTRDVPADGRPLLFNPGSASRSVAGPGHSGKESTLYAVKAVGKLQAVSPTVSGMDGIRVEVWRQDNVLFALAERVD